MVLVKTLYIGRPKLDFHARDNHVARHNDFISRVEDIFLDLTKHGQVACRVSKFEVIWILMPARLRLHDTISRVMAVSQSRVPARGCWLPLATLRHVSCLEIRGYLDFLARDS